MTPYMILYQYTDEDGLHRIALFPDSYEQAHTIIIFLVFGHSVWAQLYKWNTENENYEFLENWAPEKHQTRKEINQ